MLKRAIVTVSLSLSAMTGAVAQAGDIIWEARCIIDDRTIMGGPTRQNVPESYHIALSESTIYAKGVALPTRIQETVSQDDGQRRRFYIANAGDFLLATSGMAVGQQTLPQPARPGQRLSDAEQLQGLYGMLGGIIQGAVPKDRRIVALVNETERTTAVVFLTLPDGGQSSNERLVHCRQ